MNQQLYSYLQGLHAFIEAQDKRIQTLEITIQELQEESKTFRDRPPIKIDKIEYKFDQLKVETLEGTLNIGLNPSDMQNIEDFAVDNQGIQAPVSPKNHMHRTMEIENEIYQYLESDLPGVVAEVQKDFNITVDESYISFIKEDIKKQLPNRIDFYLKQYQASNQKQEQDRNMNGEVIQLLKKEIQNGVRVFISHLPQNMKGLKNE